MLGYQPTHCRKLRWWIEGKGQDHQTVIIICPDDPVLRTISLLTVTVPPPPPPQSTVSLRSVTAWLARVCKPINSLLVAVFSVFDKFGWNHIYAAHSIHRWMTWSPSHFAYQVKKAPLRVLILSADSLASRQSSCTVSVEVQGHDRSTALIRSRIAVEV